MGMGWQQLTFLSKAPGPKTPVVAVFIALSIGDEENPIRFELIGENTFFVSRVWPTIGGGEGRQWLFFGKRGWKPKVVHLVARHFPSRMM